MAIIIRDLDDRSAPAWDAFVCSAPGGTFFHLSAWANVIRESFRHRTYYAYAEQDGAIVGVLPLARMSTRLFGDLLASTPFCVYGGTVSSTPEAEAALEQHAIEMQERLGVPCLEFRRRDAPDPEWQIRPPLYFTFRKSMTITGDDTADLERNIPRKQRAEVRKAIKRGLVAVTDGDVNRLHRIYAESVRNLGSPVFPRRYFQLLAAAFPDAHDVTTVLHEGRPVAAVLNFHFREEVLPYYGGGTRDARGLAANDLMYWEVMRRAGAERGATLFDFGRSKLGTGAFAFKKNWGFEPQELSYCYRLGPGAALPDNNPNNPKYRLMIAAWKRLPLAVANRIGPHLVRGLG